MEYSKEELALYRLQKAKEDFSSAKELFEKNHYAQSINRSYYTVFHAARAVLAFDGFDAKKHSGVIHFFNVNYVGTNKIDEKYGKILTTAFNVRIRSDYHDFYVASKDDAKLQLEQAEQF